MSTEVSTPNTNETLPGHNFDEVENQYYVQGEGAQRFYLNGFSADLAGVQYYAPQFYLEEGASKEEAKAVLDQMVKVWGAAAIVSLGNTGALNSVRARVRTSKIPKFDDANATKEAIAKIVANSPIVYSVEDARNFIPGEREFTAASITNLIKKLNKEGKKEQAKALVPRLMAALEREQEMQALLDA